MDDFSFLITSYEGHEKDVLLLLNRNRPKPKDQRYLDWRYTCQDGPFPPVIFWVLRGENPVGMAGIVFRPYFVGSKIYHVGVLGDIALDEEYRGRGIAREWFSFANEYLREHNHRLTFVLSNRLAERALSRSGWRTVDAIHSYVFLLNPEDKIAARLRSRAVAKVFALGYSFLNSIRLRTCRKKGFSMKLLADFDDLVSWLWEAIPKGGIITRDRSKQAFRVRYLFHPDHDQFQICRFSRNGKPAGIVVHTVSEDLRHCLIYELIVLDDRMIAPIMALFIQHILVETAVSSIRFNMNTGHPYARVLKKMGFIRRERIQALQVWDDGNLGLTDKTLWFITAGDKDV